MKCKKHPKYLGIHKPKAECSVCHEIYAAELKAKEMAEEFEQNKTRNASNYLEIKKMFDKLGNLGPYWKDVDIKNQKWGKWRIESSVRVDNGYGGNVRSVVSEGDNFIEVVREFLGKVAEKDNLYKESYM